MKFQTLEKMTPAELRQAFRSGQWTGSTGGLAPTYLQANLVVLPGSLAADFEEFCELNPKPCPLVQVSEPGSAEFGIAPGSNFYSDLPRYRVIEGGAVIASPLDTEKYRGGDSVGFLLGCSVTFELALVSAGIPVRHLEAGVTAPMYNTTIACQSVGPFSGPTVVTMRAIPEAQVEEAIEITGKLPEAHGSPVHVGDPSAIGVDLSRQDYGDEAIINDGDVPVFWGCGVTPQAIALTSRLDMITHYPGAMFITDREMLT